ncbi:MAG TPA: nuclear transport factor 2 family protein, partial [Stellaceae bacterium]
MTRVLALAACFCLIVANSTLAQTAGSIQKLDDAWSQAFNKGDTAAIAAMYAPYADVLPPGHDMVKGRTAIEAFWKGATQQLGSARLLVVDVTPLGPRAAREIGTFSF